jgi:hypothetical protein
MRRTSYLCARRGLALATLLLLALAAPLSAQTTASIVGTVMDASGAAFPGVAMTATNTQTNESRTTLTETSGGYTLRNLSLGVYQVRAEVEGFKAAVRDGIRLTLNRTARVDFTLEIGEIAETVSVSAEAPLLEGSTNEMGTLIDERRVAGLPLDGRNVLDLVSLVPGAQALQTRTEQGFNINLVAFNGSRPEDSGWMLDGGDNTSLLRNYGADVPNPDAVQEFRVIASNYGAEYGRAVGAVVNVVTKSGTNALHGSAFNFHRNDSLNGDNFFTGEPDRLTQNQFGATLGGPIVKDRTFFFAAYQGFRRDAEQFVSGDNLPTEAERRGDFSQSVFQGRPVTVIDPLTRQPFPGNVIPPERISPIASRFIEEVVPLPNDPAVGPNAYSTTIPYEDPKDQILVKLDHILSVRHKLSLSYFFNDTLSVEPRGNFSFNFRDNTTRQHNFNLHEYWTVLPNLLNHFRLTFNRQAGERLLRSEPLLTAADLGINYGNVPAGGEEIGAGFVVSGYFSAAAESGGPKTSNVYTVADTLDWITGRHTVKLGTEVNLRRLFDVTLDDRVAGEYRFNGRSSGNAFADLLLGYVSDRFRYRDASYKSNNQWAFHFFVQDDFRLNKRLTLNLGLRYEIDQWPVHPLDLLYTFVPGRQSTCVPQAPRGIVFPCDEGIPRAGIQGDYDNIMPRLGFAYDLTGDGRTVVRGGFGRFSAVTLFNSLQDGQVGTPWGVRSEVRNSAAANRPATILLADPWASVAGGNPFPFPSDPESLVFPSSGLYNPNNLDMRSGYLDQFNLSVQRQIGADTVLEVAYVGSRGHNLLGKLDENLPVPSATASAANINARRPLIGDGIEQMLVFDGFVRSWYNSLQLRAERRFNKDFSGLVSYTYGKALDYQSWYNAQSWTQDHQNPAADKGRADFDRRHLLSASWVWRLPLSFEFNGLAQFYSGSPFRIFTATDNNYDGISDNDRPDLVGDPSIARPSNDEIRNGAPWFNTAAMAPNQPGQLGSMGRNIVSGPGYKNVNLSLIYNLRIKHDHRIQFRVEAFNVFDWVNFDPPNGNLNSTGFGQITSAGAARMVQLGVRYSF